MMYFRAETPKHVTLKAVREVAGGTGENPYNQTSHEGLSYIKKNIIRQTMIVL